MIFKFFIFSFFIFGSETYVRLSLLPSFQIKPGKEITRKFQFTVKEGFHIQANPASQKNLIPTVLTISKHNNFVFGKPKYPLPTPFRFKGSSEEVATYYGTFFIEVPVKAKKTAKNGLYRIKAKLKYQACDKENCFFPEELDFTIPIGIKNK